jgi:hypothetical protein
MLCVVTSPQSRPVSACCVWQRSACLKQQICHSKCPACAQHVPGNCPKLSQCVMCISLAVSVRNDDDDQQGEEVVLEGCHWTLQAASKEQRAAAKQLQVRDPPTPVHVPLSSTPGCRAMSRDDNRHQLLTVVMFKRAKTCGATMPGNKIAGR